MTEKAPSYWASKAPWSSSKLAMTGSLVRPWLARHRCSSREEHQASKSRISWSMASAKPSDVRLEDAFPAQHEANVSSMYVRRERSVVAVVAKSLRIEA